jgi:hypothetical protein
MGDTESSHWKDLYQAALLELNPVKLKERVELAERAVRQRQQELMAHSSIRTTEAQSLIDALQSLRVLKIEASDQAKSC